MCLTSYIWDLIIRVLYQWKHGLYWW